MNNCPCGAMVVYLTRSEGCMFKSCQGHSMTLGEVPFTLVALKHLPLFDISSFFDSCVK